MTELTSIHDWMLRPHRSAPAKDPKGQAIAYLSTESGQPQIHLWEAGRARQMTNHPEPVNSFAWSPLGGQILFTSCIGGDERWQLFLLDVAGGTTRPLTDDPMTVHMWGAWAPGADRIAFTSNGDAKDMLDLKVMALSDGSVTGLSAGLGHQEALAFSPDGTEVLTRLMTGAASDHQMAIVSLKDGSRRPVLQADHRVKVTSARFLKAGGGLALCDYQGDHMALWRFEDGGRAGECLLSVPGRDLDAFALTPAQDRAVVAVNEEGYSRLLLLDLADGATRPLALPFEGVVSGLSLPGDGTRLLCSITSPRSPGALWWIPLDGSAPEMILGEEPEGLMPETCAFSSFDGERIPYFFYRPEGEQPKAGWPVVFLIHGGPEMQYRPDYRGDVQWMLQQGIAVVAPNVRGSTGYGRRFHALDDREKRHEALADVTALRAHLVQAGQIDPAHCAIYGRSYGGWMVMAALTERPEDWTLGINFYGIGNFFTHLLATGPWARQLRVAEYGDPVTDRALLERISPIFQAANIRAPLLLVHADRDPRVPPGESETIHSVLFGLGRRCDFLRIAHAGHGFLRADHIRQVFGRLAETLSKDL